MKSGFNAKSLVILFLVALAIYLVGFYAIEHLRHRKGPWILTFISNSNGLPALEINQPALNIHQVTLLFHGEQTPAPGLASTLAFNAPGKSPPFGHVLFEDLTFLPGVIALNLFGHELELLPRILLVNRQPVPWESHTLLELTPSNKLSPATNRTPADVAPPPANP